MITKAVADKIKGIEGLHTISALTHRQMVELLERKVITAAGPDDLTVTGLRISEALALTRWRSYSSGQQTVSQTDIITGTLSGYARSLSAFFVTTRRSPRAAAKPLWRRGP
jgi:hypothetical protein